MTTRTATLHELKNLLLTNSILSIVKQTNENSSLISSQGIKSHFNMTIRALVFFIQLFFFPSLVASDCKCKKFIAKFHSVSLSLYRVDQLCMLKCSYSHEN